MEIDITIVVGDDEIPLHANVASFDEARLQLDAMEKFIKNRKDVTEEF